VVNGQLRHRVHWSPYLPSFCFLQGQHHHTEYRVTQVLPVIWTQWLPVIWTQYTFPLGKSLLVGVLWCLKNTRFKSDDVSLCCEVTWDLCRDLGGIEGRKYLVRCHMSYHSNRVQRCGWHWGTEVLGEMPYVLSFKHTVVSRGTHSLTIQSVGMSRNVLLTIN